MENVISFLFFFFFFFSFQPQMKTVDFGSSYEKSVLKKMFKPTNIFSFDRSKCHKVFNIISDVKWI